MKSLNKHGSLIRPNGLSGNLKNTRVNGITPLTCILFDWENLVWSPRLHPRKNPGSALGGVILETCSRMATASSQRESTFTDNLTYLNFKAKYLRNKCEPASVSIPSRPAANMTACAKWGLVLASANRCSILEEKLKNIIKSNRIICIIRCCKTTLKYIISTAEQHVKCIYLDVTIIIAVNIN